MQPGEKTEGLPAGWRQSRTPTGRIYFLNDATRTTQWEWPGLPAAWPAGWREAFDAGGRSIQPSLRPPQQPAPPPPQRETPQSFSPHLLPQQFMRRHEPSSASNGTDAAKAVDPFRPKFAVPALPAHHPQLAQAVRSKVKVPEVPTFGCSEKVVGAALAAAPSLPLASLLPPAAQVKTESPQAARSKIKVPAVPAFDSSEKVVGAALAAAAPLSLAPPLPPAAQVKTEDDCDDDVPLAAKLEQLAPSRAATDAPRQDKHEHGKEAHVIKHEHGKEAHVIKHEHGKEAHVIFVVDISASMKTRDGRNGSGGTTSRMGAVKESCLDFVRTHLQQEATPGVHDLYSLVFFNDSAHVAVRRQLLSPALLRQACGLRVVNQV